MPKKKKTPYETLGVEPKTDKETVKKAYRKKSKETHPDKGGDPKEFAELNAAFRLLTDETLRKNYDERGDESDGVNNSHAEAVACLGICLNETMEFVLKSWSENVNFVQVLKDTIHQHIRETEARLDYEKKAKVKTEKIKKELINKGEGKYLEDYLDSGMKNFNKEILKGEHILRKFKGAMDLLRHYEMNMPGFSGMMPSGMFKEYKTVSFKLGGSSGSTSKS